MDEILTRQVAEILPSKEGLAALMKKKKIRLYLGIDPTGSRLHLGHSIALRKLQQFASAGHEAILVIGTGTVLAGDPSQRDKARTRITQQEIQENMKSWKAQAKKIIDFSKVKIRYNGEWLKKLKLPDILAIASHPAASHLYQRDKYQKRIERGDTIGTHELMYPLLQGYDSVALDVDLEIGGTDQVFNMLVGRELQKKMNSKEKFVLTVPMIVGLDGKTMSKTSGNTVNIADSPKDMYGKLMTLQDSIVKQYFELCTDIPLQEVSQLEKTLSARDFKARLAREITALYYGEKKARAAEEEFVRVFQKKEKPKDMRELPWAGQQLGIVVMLVQAGMATSRAEARRLVEQGGVKINDVMQQDWSATADLKKGDVIQVGKLKFARIV